MLKTIRDVWKIIKPLFHPKRWYVLFCLIRAAIITILVMKFDKN